MHAASSASAITTAKGVLRNCRCWTNLPLATGLSTKPHAVVFTNLAFTGLIVHTWAVDHGGSFLEHATPVDPPQATVAAGASMSFYEQDAGSIVLYTAQGSDSAEGPPLEALRDAFDADLVLAIVEAICARGPQGR